MSAGQNSMPHPDENLLAAFAEQALAGAQRESVLLHLSSCARCREIVFLAQEAAPQPEAGAESAVRPTRRHWLRWQTATAGAWLVAIVAAAALLWQGRRVVPLSNEQAIVHPVVPPVTSRAEENQPAKVLPAPPPPPPAADQSQNKVADNKSLNAPANSVYDRIEQAHAAALKPAAPVQSFIAPPAGAPEQQNAMATDPLRAMPVQGRQVAPSNSSVARTQAAPLAPEVINPPTMFEASSGQAESQSEVIIDQRKAAVAGSPAMQVAAAVPISQFSVIKGKLRRLGVDGYTNVAVPAGTTAQAVAAYANVVLLLTRQSALYRSTDVGDHWIRVPAQWNGKAIAVHVRPASSFSPRKRDAAGSNAGAIGEGTATNDARSAGALQSAGTSDLTGLRVPVAKNPTAAVFELTTSAGKRWLSRDGGQTWRPE